MASIFTDKERNERINLVGEYFFSHPHSSIREISNYFSNMENGFKISGYTVFQYIKKYRLLVDSDIREKIDAHIYNNKPSTVDDENVKKRVLTFAHLCIDCDMDVQEIVDCISDSNITYWVVYRDLTVRLSKIDVDLYNQVCSIMEERRKKNLKMK